MRVGILTGTVVVASALVLGACSSHSSHSSPATIPVSAAFNASDVAFAQGMIPHHAQAIEMADMAVGRSTDPAVLDLARRIRTAQDPEIATMSGWLRTWGQPVPMDMTHGDHDMGEMDPMMDGMMSQSEMDALSSSTGVAFDRSWIDMMIRHHEGALEMARQELAGGKFADARALAQSIISGQTAEIGEMRGLLARMPA